MSILNLGLLAHVDAGKTTTVEQLLYLTGSIRTLGSVDAGTAQTDWLSIERQRGISIRTSEAALQYGDLRINLIDTPGHIDFSGEVGRSLAALDAAVLLVSCAEGIQSQTEQYWNALRERRIPTMILVNKIDRAGCDPEAVTAELKETFSNAVIPLQKVTQWGGRDCALCWAELGEDEKLELAALDEVFADRYLSGEEISPAQWDRLLAGQVQKGNVFPLCFSAMAQGTGGEELLQALLRYFSGRELQPEGEPTGVIYKLEHDRTMGKVAHVRMFTGTIRNRDSVPIFRAGEAEPVQEKITQIRKVSGAKQEDVGVLMGGDVAAVYGFAGARAGDLIGTLREQAERELTQPLFSAQVLAGDGMENRALEAVQELAEEDPLLDYLWNPDTRELSIRIMGKIQLEVLKNLIQERYGLDVEFSPPAVIYRETPAKQGTGKEVYLRPKPCWAILTLQVDPLPRGSGYQYESKVKEGQLFLRYQNHIQRVVPETLKQGLLGWEVTDLKVTLTDGKHHPVHTHPMDFFVATPMAVMRALEDAGTLLLEPVLRMKIRAAEEFSSRIIRDVMDMRGTFDNPVIKNGNVYLEAYVPVATSMDYAAQFASATSGKGLLRSSFYQYQECPLELGAVCKRRGIDPRDRDTWILHKRGAIQ